MNQNSNAPNHIIASGLRLWDAVMADVGQKAAEGILDSGTLTYGIRENTLKVGFEGSNVEVPNEIKKEMETYLGRYLLGNMYFQGHWMRWMRFCRR